MFSRERSLRSPPTELIQTFRLRNGLREWGQRSVFAQSNPKFLKSGRRGLRRPTSVAAAAAVAAICWGYRRIEQ